MRRTVFALAASVVACSTGAGDDAASIEAAQTTASVTPSSLLDELFDRASVTRTKVPAFTTFMHSSRAPMGPDAPLLPRDAAERARSFARCGIEIPNPCAGDFNMDFVPGREGETEIDRVELPNGGVLGRFFTVVDPDAVAPRTIRFWVDDDPVPLSLTIPATSNAALPFPFGDPDVPAARSVLGAVTENGIVVRTPIAFRRTLRITNEGRPTSGRLYFQATYRRYDERVALVPMPTQGPALDALRDKARALSDRFWAAPSFGAAATNAVDLPGAGTVNALQVEVAPDAREWQIGRARLVVTVGGVTTVDVPLLDFFATALARDGVRAVVDHEGGLVSARNLPPVRFRGVPFVLTSRWPIPFANGARIAVRDLPGTRLAVATSPETAPRTLHATAVDVSARAAQPEVRRVLDLAGEGAYVGTTLAVDNGTDPTWWGEGDELVRADDTLVMAGTGMEDFFGYGYSSSMTFGGALHAQAVASNRRPGIKPAPWAGADTYDNTGVAVNTRAMIFDRVPFSRRLTFDWELLHTHYLRPFMQGEPPPHVRFDASWRLRVVHHWYAR